MRLFEKNDIAIGVADKFIYKVETYVAWHNGISLYSEKHISAEKPIKFSKKTLCTKKSQKDKWWLVRFIELQYAPESFLIRNGYKEIL